MDKKDLLVSLDQARDRFLATFEKVPDEALGYLRPGDDYALGGLLPHVTWVLARYGRVLDGMVGAGFGELRASSSPGEAERVAAEARQGLDSARASALDALRDAHERVVVRLRAMAEGDLERKAPAFYDGANDAYPTSAADIVGWLEGHYDEHTPHVEQLLAAYGARPG